MGTFYKECGPDEYEMLAALIDKYRDDLKEADARITLLFASSDKEGVPALKARGHAAAGRAQVNNAQDRAEGKADATIAIDFDSWSKRTDMRKLALIHHELAHVGCERGKVHPDGRPKLYLRPADWETDGFDEVVAIYGPDAQERRNLDAIEDRLRQECLPMG